MLKPKAMKRVSHGKEVAMRLPMQSDPSASKGAAVQHWRRKSDVQFIESTALPGSLGQKVNPQGKRTW